MEFKHQTINKQSYYTQFKTQLWPSVTEQYKTSS